MNANDVSDQYFPVVHAATDETGTDRWLVVYRRAKREQEAARKWQEYRDTWDPKNLHLADATPLEPDEG